MNRPLRSGCARLSRSVAALVIATASFGFPLELMAQGPSTMRAARQRAGETRLDVHVRYGAGEFTLTAADPPGLYEASLRYDEDSFEPVHEFSGERLLVGIEGNPARSLFGRGISDSGLDLRLSREVPMDLELEFGAVRADLDLGGLRLEQVDLSTGASEVELRVSEPNPEPMTVVRLAVGAASLRARELGNLNAESFVVEAGVGDVRLDLSGLRRETTNLRAEMGLGNLEIRVPSEAGVRLSRESFLTALEAPELVRLGDALVSPNWDASETRITIDVEAAFGKVSLLRSD